MAVTNTSSASGGVLTALGLGSGLDIDALVSALTESEMSAANQRVTREQQSVTAQVSALASLKSALSVFQASLLAFTTSANYGTRSVVSSDADLLTAKVDADAVPGSYNVSVEQVATAQQLVSTTFAGGATTNVGYGQLTIDVGGSSINVDIDSTHATLADIRDAINAATGNTKVSASLIYGSNGSARLALSSNVTGASNTITVSTAGGDGGLSALTYSVSDTSHYTEEQEAFDAIVNIAGEPFTSSSNTISNAIDGLTLNLKEAAPGTDVTLKVTNAPNNITTLVKDLVTAYNTMQSSLRKLGAYDASTKTAGALLGDPLYNGVTRQLSRTLMEPVSGIDSIYSSLASLGVTTNATGQLTINDTKLSAALSADFTSVSKVINGDNGLISRLNDMMDEALSSKGAIAARDATLDSRQEAIDDQKTLIELRTEKVQQRYMAKFNAMDTLLARLHNTSDFLSQQFDALTRDTK